MSTHPEPLGQERRDAPRTGSQPARRAMFGLFRLIGEHVRGFHAAIGALLIVALAIILVCVVFFAMLANVVMAGGTQEFDDAVLLWMNQHASPELTDVALNVSALGAGMTVWLMVIVASVFLWSTRHRWSVGLLWVSILGSGLINSSMKLFFERPRPQLFPWRAPYAGLSSFPSGHSMTAMVCYATLAYLVTRLEATRFLRRFTFAVAALLIVLIGLSRMYLGVHYPTDVLAGFTMGLAWAAFCALGLEALRYFRHRKPEVAAQEKDLDATVAEGPQGV
ncbi:MAG: phosphatase PAP2 family protein [Longimicrobiaceae bacterium]